MRPSHIEVFRGRGEGRLGRRRWFWHVVAGNGQIVATGGQGYATRWNAERAAVKRNPDLAGAVRRVEFT